MGRLDSNRGLLGGERGIEVLSVEDSLGDQKLIAAMFMNSVRKHRVSFVCDGEEALMFLRQQGRFLQAPRPDVILLDMRLPRKNGHEVLKEIRAEEKYRDIPIIVLTTNAIPAEAQKCRELKGNCYIQKPSDPDDLLLVLRVVEYFCDILEREIWVDLNPDLLKSELVKERAKRKSERDDLIAKLYELKTYIGTQEKVASHPQKASESSSVSPPSAQQGEPPQVN